MRLYGSDKPDMRIPWIIQDATDALGKDFIEQFNSILRIFKFEEVIRELVCTTNCMQRASEKHLRI